MPQLGIARGLIRVDTSRLAADKRVVVQTARQMGNAFRTAFSGQAGVLRGFRNDLKQVQTSLANVRGELLGISAAGAGLTGLGLKAADNLRVLQARFTAVAGSQRLGIALMERLEERANRLGQPVRETQQTLAGIVIQLREAGENVEDFVDIAARLRLVDPTARAFDVQVALREAISGNFLSLQRRFEFPPAREIKALVEETGSLSQALDIILTRMGASSDLAEEMGQGFQGAARRVRNAAREALERAFTPALESAAEKLDRLAQLIENAPDGLLQFAGSATIAVTGIAASALAVERLASGLSSVVGLARTAAPAIARLGVRGAVGAGAIAAGTGIGLGLVRAGGRAFGNERLANFDLQQAGELLKQAVFLIVNALVQGARQVALAFSEVVLAFLTMPQQIERISGNIEIAFANLVLSIANALQRLADVEIAGVRPFSGSEGLAGQLRTRGEGGRAAGQARVEAASAIIGQRREAIRADVNAFFDEVQLGFGRAFGFIESEAEETEDAVERHNPFDAIRQQAAGIGRAISAALEKQQADLVESLQERIQFEQELSKLLREGTPEQVEDRLQALQDEQAAIEKLLPGLQALAETNEDAAESAEQYRRRLTQIDEQMVDLGHALVVAAQRATETLDHEFLQKIGEIEAEREKALGEAFAEFEQDLADLDAEVAKRRGSLRDDQIEALDDFQERETKLVAAHMERLLEIERRSRRSILDAAARLDAAGVFAARERRQEELREAEKRRDDEREGSAERLDEQRERLGEEAAQIAEYYAERRGELETAHRQELNQIRSRFDAEIATERSAYNAERAQLQAHLQSKLAQERASQTSERLIRQAGQAAMLDDARRFAQGLTALGNQLGASVSAARQPQAAASRARSFGSNLLDLGRTTLGNLREAAQQQGRVVSVGGARTRSGASIPSGGAVNTITSAIGRVFRFNAAGASAFQTGGVPRFAGGSGFLFAENKERVLSERQNAAFERMVDFVTASGGSGRDLSRVSVDVSGAESVEALIADITRQVLGQVYEASIRGQEG